MSRFPRSSFVAVVLAASAFAADPALDQGKAIYDAKCSQCHGDQGDGKGVGADFFDPKPRDFTSGAYKIRTTESGELPTHGDIKDIIRRGLPYTGMPAWPSFTDVELDALAKYLETFNEDFADTANLTKPIVIPKPPKYSAESAAKGRKVYEENKCLDCHGKLGYGDGESAPTLKDDFGVPIRPADLTKPWTFRGGSQREDIYRTFTTGLNGTPMPSFASSIAEPERWNLVDYLVSLSPTAEPAYASVILAESTNETLDLSKGAALFASAKPAMFPVIGQVVENPRNFFPGVNAVEVRAVYDSNDLALMVSWHDMSAEREGKNTPVTRDSASDSLVADAIGIQIPLKASDGVAKPYFLFGDGKNPVEIWFSILAANQTILFSGKGGRALTETDEKVESRSEYVDGEWRAYFKRPRRPEKRLAIGTEEFIPIAFSVWDGFNREKGSKRGVTSWVSLYLKPATQQSPLKPAAAKGGILLAIELVILFLLRQRYRKSLKGVQT